MFPRMRISSWRPPTMGVSNHTSISLRAVSDRRVTLAFGRRLPDVIDKLKVRRNFERGWGKCPLILLLVTRTPRGSINRRILVDDDKEPGCNETSN